MLKVAIMLLSPPKYLFSIEIEISAIVISSIIWILPSNHFSGPIYTEIMEVHTSEASTPAQNK